MEALQIFHNEIGLLCDSVGTASLLFSLAGQMNKAGMKTFYSLCVS